MLKSNAAPNEISSPFYIKNEEFCLKINNFIANKNGLIKGQYNSWSYNVAAKIIQPKKWNIQYRKATLSNSGNLLLSSKTQGLLTLSIWQTRLNHNENFNFKIRKRKLADSLYSIFNKRIQSLPNHSKYTLILKNKQPKFLSFLISNLDELFNSQNVFIITFKNQSLKIELRSEQHHFDILNKLISHLN